MATGCLIALIVALLVSMVVTLGHRHRLMAGEVVDLLDRDAKVAVLPQLLGVGVRDVIVAYHFLAVGAVLTLSFDTLATCSLSRKDGPWSIRSFPHYHARAKRGSSGPRPVREHGFLGATLWAYL